MTAWVSLAATGWMSRVCSIRMATALAATVVMVDRIGLPVWHFKQQNRAMV